MPLARIGGPGADDDRAFDKEGWTIGRKAMLISIHGDPLAGLGGIQAGGQNVYVRQVALGLQHHGWEVDVFSHWQDAAAPAEERLGPKGRVIRLAAGRKGFIPKDELYQHLPSFLRELKDYLRRAKRRYELIHSNYWLSGLAGLALKRELGLPQFHTFHSLGTVRTRESRATRPVPPRRLAAEREIVAGVDCLVATTPEEREDLVSDYGARYEQIALVPCGVDPDIFSPGERSASKAALGLKGKGVVVYVGRLEESKGLGVLLAALEALAQNDAHFPARTRVLLIGGERCERERLERELDGRGLAGWVWALGAQPQEELPRYFRAADVCVVPSYYETFGLVAIEAMACGTPVIASRVGGLKYTVIDGVTGFHVPPRDPRALAARLAEALADPAKLEHLGQAAARRVQHLFTWPRVAERLARLYGGVKAWDTQGTPLSVSF